MTREHSLAVAVLDCLLRENYGGLAGRVRPGPVLALPSGAVLPLTADGFLADVRIAGGRQLSLADVDAVLDAVADPRDAAGVAAFRAECRDALAAPEPDGPPASAEAAAARLPHPAYPTWQARTGFTAADARRYGPEFSPEFELRWVALPLERVSLAGDARPLWFPGFADVGLPESLAASHVLFPVHPVTARKLPGAAPGGCAPRPWLRVRPTLSVRTVEVPDRPGVQLKLPLPVSTLGRRNTRALAPGALADGALVGGVLTGLAARDPDLGRLLVADDGSYAHAGHPFVGYLLRRLPSELDGTRTVPVAALLAPSVLDELAGGDVAGFFRAYLDLVFGVAVTLFVRYGIALESHQQNAAVVCSADGGLRLLVKDFDGTLVRRDRVDPAAFADRRLLTDSDDALADVFITITVHLCAGAIAFGLARQGRAPLPWLLGTIRAALSAALGRHPGDPAAKLLRARVLDADRLPGKAMVTAGTLVGKSRTGASDINKYYGTSGPNYLRSSP